MTEAEKHRFNTICSEEAYAEGARESIGTYGEKRLHRILKRFYANEAGETEASVGSYVADVLRDTEIVVISDEIYSELVYSDHEHTAFASIPGMRERTVTINGFSKAFGGGLLPPHQNDVTFLWHTVASQPTSSGFAPLNHLPLRGRQDGVANLP